jgi:tetratricopeptide (TPR) repeat protein
VSNRSTYRAWAAVWLGVLCCGGAAVLVGRAEPPQEEADWRGSDPVVRAVNRGVMLMEQYEYGAAVEAFGDAVKLDPESIEAKVDLAIALYNRSEKGDVEKANGLLDKVLEEHPDNPQALYFRGIVCQYTGKDEEAIEYFERVLRLHPDDAYVWYLLARSKSHLNQPYRKELERAIELNPMLSSAYYDLMRLSMREGKREEAREYQRIFTRLRESPLSETVVMPQYQQMGPLAVVRPIAARPKSPISGGELSPGKPRELFHAGAFGPDAPARARMLRAAYADVNGDGRVDMAAVSLTGRDTGHVMLRLRQADGTFADATEKSGLKTVHDALSCAFGDYDNDDKVDLFFSCAGPNHLFRGRGDGTFEDVTAGTGTSGGEVRSLSAVFLDADHDADLDVYVCNATGPDDGAAANQLLNNNADGTFTDIAAQAGVACAENMSFMMAPADVDGDRDTDLVVFNEGAPVRVFLNDRLGKYHEGKITEAPFRTDSGGVAQDFNGDGAVDLLILPGGSEPGRLLLSGGTGILKSSDQFDECAKALASYGEVLLRRVADIDLDGDLDLVAFGKAGHVLLNDGYGRFVLRPRVWPDVCEQGWVYEDLVELTGDGVPDVMRSHAGEDELFEVVPTVLTPPANWVAITPTGTRSNDQSTRSPSSGYGVRMELRCGLHGQFYTYTGLNGGLDQSQVPVVFGLDGAKEADYLALTWPDGVTQAEGALVADVRHRIEETQRRISSCPVLFAWDGEHFGFVGDFAGVGGLGYFLAPGEYAMPQVVEHVRLGPGQLRPRDGLYELRMCEPMEEVAYVDRLELVAVDHSEQFSVYPDERLVIGGAPATQKLLCPKRPIFPERAFGPDGQNCAERLREADRKYAYQPPRDRRFVGFCEPHALVLDFGDGLASLSPDRPVYLFLNGWIEYPYSQTTYAASQAHVAWHPLKVEALDGAEWRTVVADGGSPGGMGRTIAVDLTGKLPAGASKLRVSTNLEIYIDQAFVAADRGTEGFVRRTVPLHSATLRWLGFPKEVSPDGAHPTVYTYDQIQPSSPLKLLRGEYTRYGRVDELLSAFDDRYVILGTGDEIVVAFDAGSLPPVPDGWARSFLLISHAYCKDMDLYTATPDTVEPLPFRGMSKYPYPREEAYPDTPGLARYRDAYNTRWVD